MIVVKEFRIVTLRVTSGTYSPEYTKHTLKIYHEFMIIEHIGIESTRLSSEIPHTRTNLAS
jgi:hypothetical protein